MEALDWFFSLNLKGERQKNFGMSMCKGRRLSLYALDLLIIYPSDLISSWHRKCSRENQYRY